MPGREATRAIGRATRRPAARLLLALALAGCATPAPAGGGPDAAPVTPAIAGPVLGHVVVGARTLVDSRLVAEVYAQSLESAGYEVERQYSFERSRDANEALLLGAIDLYPERATDAAGQVLGLLPGPSATPLAVTVRDAYALFGVTWLAPLPPGGPEDLAPVVRLEALERMPGLAVVLEAASRRLDSVTLARLSDRVTEDRREPAAAVGEWLAGVVATDQE